MSLTFQKLDQINNLKNNIIEFKLEIKVYEKKFKSINQKYNSSEN